MPTRTGVEGLLPLLHSGPPTFLMAFSGTFDYTLDAKNRLTVPAKFRTSLSDSVMITRGNGDCLAIWPKRDFEEFVSSALQGTGVIDPRRDAINRYYFSNSFETELDSAGRVMVPTQLMAHGKLAKDVVVNGVGDRIEIWDRQGWAEYNAKLDVSDFASIFGAGAA